MAYRNLPCELSEFLAEGNDDVTINTKYLEPNEALPVMEPIGEVGVHDSISLRHLIQECEHTGCSSGRARAILVIAESCSGESI